MNINKSSLFWGVLLIGAGVLALADRFGYIQDFSETIWIVIFGAISLLGFVSYAVSGWKEWGWLFPAGVFGGLALVILLSINNMNSAAIASPLFLGLLIPFAAAYLTDRTRNWWALIPGSIMLFLALTTLIVDFADGEWIAAIALLAISLSFLIVYLNDRTRTWALIVAYIFGVLSMAPILAAFGNEADYFGSVFLFGIALPFYILYFRSAKNWWAIIPAGALSVVAVIATLAIAGLINDASSGGYIGAFLMGGLAATFAVLWLRDHKDWARSVTIVLGVLGVASVFFVSFYEIFWPVAIILGGLYLLITALQPGAA